MWKRKELKDKAKDVVKKNYWTAIVVCFILAMITGEFGTSTIGWVQRDDSLDPIYVINQTSIVNQDVDQREIENIKKDVLEIKEKILKIEREIIPERLTDVEQKTFEMIKSNVNSATKSQKYIIKIWDAITSFNIKEPFLGITISITALMGLLYTIIIGDPLIVAGRKYFLVAREGENVKTSGIASNIFKRENWINVATIMFLRNLYNFLWYFTIIGGVIKMYEYRMIPYILAEKPQIERKRAFKLSKEMMKHNKWRAFVLDLSFIWWSIASILTLGIVNILYANPYKAATSTELYVTLRDNIYSEELNESKEE